MAYMELFQGIGNL